MEICTISQYHVIFLNKPFVQFRLTIEEFKTGVVNGPINIPFKTGTVQYLSS